MAIQILQDISLMGGIAFLDDKTDFPVDAPIGTLILKAQCLYARIKIGDLETWYPFANKTSSYIHIQGIPALTWTVVHNLATTDLWIQVLDDFGNIVNVGKTDINDNSFTLNFTSPVAGRCVVVAPNSIRVPTVSAGMMTIGDTVEINSTGVKVNGSYLLSGVDLSAKQDTLVSGTNIKTFNGSSVLGSGDVAFQTPLVSGTDIKTINNSSVLGSGNLDLQPTLVSGTSIKTINGTSVLGSGDIVTGNVTSTGTQTLTNKTIEAATFTNGYVEETNVVNSGTAYTIDLANGSLQYVTLTGNCVYTFPTPTAGKSFTLIQKQNATGSRTVTWPGNVAWPGGSAPTITSTANKTDKFIFTAEGSRWLGSVAGQNY